MKAQINVKKEVEIVSVRVALAVRYEEEDIPNSFPLRSGDMWNATIDVDTGRVHGWPQGTKGDLRMKVCDEGSYYLIEAEGKEVAGIENDYVPHGMIPGEYGDYINLQIDENGIVTNWPKHPDIEDFLGEED